MPAKNDFVRAGRWDLARAVERWGGLFELAQKLGYRTETASRQTEGPSHRQWRVSRTPPPCQYSLQLCLAGPLQLNGVPATTCP
jgi:hypothetical protein